MALLPKNPADGRGFGNNRALGCDDNARKPLDFQRINAAALARLPDLTIRRVLSTYAVLHNPGKRGNV